jgi:hypothetical protein
MYPHKMISESCTVHYLYTKIENIVFPFTENVNKKICNKARKKNSLEIAVFNAFYDFQR